MRQFYLLIISTLLILPSFGQTKGSEAVIKQQETQQVKIIRFFPNPASSVINFEFIQPLRKDYTLQVYNFVGKKVYELFSISQKTIIPLNDFYRGVYIFQIRDKGGRIVDSGKFQVVK